jgi:hypothetical protein
MGTARDAGLLKESKTFFFERKNQKTFAAMACAGGAGGGSFHSVQDFS